MLKKLIDTVNENTIIPLDLSEYQIEQIYAAGVAHGLFSDSNYGIHDKRNSVCCLINVLKDLKKVTPNEIHSFNMPSHEMFLWSNSRFVSFFSSRWAIQTPWGVFEWDNPNYGGNGSIHYISQTWGDYCELRKISSGGRERGDHIVGEYIGTNFKLMF